MQWATAEKPITEAPQIAVECWVERANRKPFSEMLQYENTSLGKFIPFIKTHLYPEYETYAIPYSELSST